MSGNPKGRVDVAVIGGGAAGLMAAIHAARAGCSTALLEGSKQSGLKILVSGGGRCNVLPSAFDEKDFHTQGSRNVLRRLFRTWPLAAVTEFFQEDLAVPLTIEPETGKVFPRSQRAKDVRDALVVALQSAGAVQYCPWRVVELARRGASFRVTSLEGAVLDASRVILATGGRSLPRTGSDGAGYGFAVELGHTMLQTYPALVPLSTADEELRALTGVSLPVRWRAVMGKRIVEERERELLFTHRGFSGPAMLDASHWSVRDGAKLLVAWKGIGREEWQRRFDAQSRRECRAIIAEELPRRLTEIICSRAGLPDACRPAHLPRLVKNRLLSLLSEFELPTTGNVGYRVAEVTGGGIPIGEVTPSTLESRYCRGLFLCGEILDVIGRIGGYNFLWAWVTGKLAGESAARMSR